MFELLVGLAAILAILLIAAVFYARTYRADLAHETKVAKALEGRVTTLRADNIALEREVGRLKAEKVALEVQNTSLKNNHGPLLKKVESLQAQLSAFEAKAPKRGKGGRFAPKNPKPDPIRCG